LSDDIRPRFKLGRIRPKARPLALRLGAYLDRSLAAATLPPSVDYTTKAKAAIAEMYLNDSLGDCVVAGLGHSIGIWSGNDTGNPVIATDNEIQAAYRTICGPGDNGCVITDVLDYTRDHGVTLGGKLHKIDSYVAIDHTVGDEIKAGIYLFGVVKLGINLPAGWEQTDDGGVWDIPSGLKARIIGGHDVEACGYSDEGVVISTWGGLRTITWAAFTSTRYVEEAYALLGPDWYGSDKLAPCGLDVVTLQADLAKLSSGVIPPIDPPAPEPTPTPVPVGLTLDQAIRAVAAGIASLAPYEGENVADQVELAAISALQSAWASGGS
jgi:hypothetical protein